MTTLVQPRLPKHQLKLVGVPFAEVGWRCCWYPFGELLERPVLFCGEPAVDETSWCAEHYGVVYDVKRVRAG